MELESPKLESFCSILNLILQFYENCVGKKSKFGGQIKIFLGQFYMLQPQLSNFRIDIPTSLILHNLTRNFPTPDFPTPCSSQLFFQLHRPSDFIYGQTLLAWSFLCLIKYFIIYFIIKKY